MDGQVRDLAEWTAKATGRLEHALGVKIPSETKVS